MRITIDIDGYGEKETKVLADESADLQTGAVEAAGAAPTFHSSGDAPLDHVEDTMETGTEFVKTEAVDAEFVGAGPAGPDRGRIADEAAETGIDSEFVYREEDADANDAEDAGAGPVMGGPEATPGPDVYEELTHEEPVEDEGNDAEAREEKKS